MNTTDVENLVYMIDAELQTEIPIERRQFLVGLKTRTIQALHQDLTHYEAIVDFSDDEYDIDEFIETLTQIRKRMELLHFGAPKLYVYQEGEDSMPIIRCEFKRHTAGRIETYPGALR